MLLPAHLVLDLIMSRDVRIILFAFSILLVVPTLYCGSYQKPGQRRPNHNNNNLENDRRWENDNRGDNDNIVDNQRHLCIFEVP